MWSDNARTHIKRAWRGTLRRITSSELGRRLEVKGKQAHRYTSGGIHCEYTLGAF